METFALIGAAGYVAPRHMAAVRDVGGEIVAALDPHDSVGILDQYFPRCLYFREPERFDRWLSRNRVDYVIVCSPNYLHDAHCLMAMRNRCDVICEKPLVLHERNLDNLAEWEERTRRTVNVILQCRLHPDVLAAERALGESTQERFSVRVRYQAPRGPWYKYSWKGDPEKSGGIVANIGIHLFDLCAHLFGPMNNCESWVAEDRATGRISLQSADVGWFLSTMTGTPAREFNIGGHIKIDLTDGITNLHTRSYQEILLGRGFGIEDIRPATQIVERIRQCRSNM